MPFLFLATHPRMRHVSAYTWFIPCEQKGESGKSQKQI